MTAHADLTPEDRMPKGASPTNLNCLGATEMRAYTHYVRISNMLGREPTIDEAFPALQIPKWRRWKGVARGNKKNKGELTRQVAARALTRLLKRIASHYGAAGQQCETLRAEIGDKARRTRIAVACISRAASCPRSAPSRRTPTATRSATGRGSARRLRRPCCVWPQRTRDPISRTRRRRGRISSLRRA